IGSVSISSSLPAGLGHSRNGSLVREVAEADPAELVAAEHGARPAAAVAARVRANAVLRLALLLHAERGLGHVPTRPFSRWRTASRARAGAPCPARRSP